MLLMGLPCSKVDQPTEHMSYHDAARLAATLKEVFDGLGIASAPAVYPRVLLKQTGFLPRRRTTEAEAQRNGLRLVFIVERKEIGGRARQHEELLTVRRYVVRTDLRVRGENRGRRIARERCARTNGGFEEGVLGGEVQRPAVGRDRKPPAGGGRKRGDGKRVDVGWSVPIPAVGDRLPVGRPRDAALGPLVVGQPRAGAVAPIGATIS